MKRLLGKQNRTEGTCNSKHLNLYQNSNHFFAYNLFHIRGGTHGGKWFLNKEITTNQSELFCWLFIKGGGGGYLLERHLTHENFSPLKCYAKTKKNRCSRPREIFHGTETCYKVLFPALRSSGGLFLQLHRCFLKSSEWNCTPCKNNLQLHLNLWNSPKRTCITDWREDSAHTLPCQMYNLDLRTDLNFFFFVRKFQKTAVVA